MKKTNECCPGCGKGFKPGDRTVAVDCRTGEGVEGCVLCGEHFKAQDDLIEITVHYGEVEHDTMVHMVCLLRAQLAERGYK